MKLIKITNIYLATHTDKTRSWHMTGIQAKVTFIIISP